MADKAEPKSRVIKIKKPKAILLELTGTLATREFMTYSKSALRRTFEHIHEYFEECYPKQKELRLDVNYFKNQEQMERKNQTFDPRCPTVIDENRRLPLPNAVIAHILFRIDHQDFVPPLTLFMLHYNEWAYRKGIYLTPVYREVRSVLESWKRQNIDVYVDAASESFVQMVLTHTTQGNLWSLITRNISLMQFQGANSYRDFSRLQQLVHCQPNEIVVITRFAQDAKQACRDGYEALLLLRDDFEPNWRRKERKAFPPNKIKTKTSIRKDDGKLVPLVSSLAESGSKSERGSSLIHLSQMPTRNISVVSSFGSQGGPQSSTALRKLSDKKSVTSKLDSDDEEESDNSGPAAGGLRRVNLHKSSGLSLTGSRRLEQAFSGIDLPGKSKLDRKSSAIAPILEETASKILSMAESIESFHSGSNLNLTALSKATSVIHYKDLQKVRYVNSLNQIAFY